MTWKFFWKKYDSWYNGHSWEDQRKKLVSMLSEYIGKEKAKRLMSNFDMITNLIENCIGLSLDNPFTEWDKQAILIQNLYKIETKKK